MKSLASLFYGLFLVAAVAEAATPVCVRSYRTGNTYVCDLQDNNYTYVYPVDRRVKKVCARIYSDVMCETSPKEYNYVEAMDGTTICVMNYNQPPVSNLCDSLPMYYLYVLDGPPNRP